MQETLNTKPTNLGRMAIGMALVLVVATATISTPAARADQGEQQQSPGFSTGLLGIVPGQRARLTLWNKGDQPILARLQFVDDQAKILIQCDDIIQPGKSESLEFNGTGGVARTELQAQFGTNAKRSIGLLMPTLQVIDSATGATSWMIGQEGFTEFQLIPPVPRH